MASRRSGFDPDDARQRLAGAISRAVEVVGGVKDVVVRTSRIGRMQVGAVLLRRERSLLLERIGLEVVERRAELELPEELEALVDEALALGRRIEEQEAAAASVRRTDDALREAGEAATRSTPGQGRKAPRREDETPEGELE